MYHEKKVSDSLTKQGIENYLPMQETIRQWSDRRKRVKVLVISMMIFVHVTEADRIQVLQHPSVIHYLSDKEIHKPIVIPDDQMDRFRFMLDYSEDAVEMSSEPLVVGEAVRVIKGPLIGLEGTLVKADQKTKVAISIDSLGCAYVDMPIGFVERV